MGKKLTSENGETLTELLISVLVIALGLSMFAAALTGFKKNADSWDGEDRNLLFGEK